MIFQVPNDFLGESSQCPLHDVNMSSVPDFLTSIGLPMYIKPLMKDGGYRSIHSIKDMPEADWRRHGINNADHLTRINKARELLAFKFGIKSKKLCSVDNDRNVGTPITELRDKV